MSKNPQETFGKGSSQKMADNQELLASLCLFLRCMCSRVVAGSFAASGARSNARWSHSAWKRGVRRLCGMIYALCSLV